MLYLKSNKNYLHLRKEKKNYLHINYDKKNENKETSKKIMK